MLEHIRQTIQKYQLITTGQTLVIGVSGGTDSLILLYLLCQLAPRLGITIHAATFDHQLRGAESAADVQFVEQICREWNVAVTTGQTDVASLARQRHLGIEAAARLAQSSVGGPHVVVGRTARGVVDEISQRPNPVCCIIKWGFQSQCDDVPP